MHKDCIIVGQGLCGTLLSYELVKAGKSVLVIDESQPYTSGKVASGLINPVTGMRVAKSWMMDELLPVAIDRYSELEQELNISIINKLSILEFHPNTKHRDTFNERISQYPEHLAIHNEEWSRQFNYHYGIGEVTSSMVIDIRTLQDAWRTKLKATDALLEERFSEENVQINGDSISYKGTTADKIIFCDGAAGLNNKWFSLLPFSLNKGEILLASIPGLPRDHVYKHSLKIAPWENDLFWVGTSFEWTFDHLDTTDTFRQRTEWQLNNWLKLPYTIHDHWASVRPATIDHKPFAGFHPLHPNIGILNGMGAKGCSQAPYFAMSLANNIISGTPIHREADVARYQRILSR